MIRDILLLQKREIEAKLKEQYLEREVRIKNFDTPLIKVIIGPRRVGKSSFAVKMLSQLKSYGYVNFDDERLVQLKDYDELVSALNSLYNSPKYLLFDEIQNLPGWELFINRLHRAGH